MTEFNPHTAELELKYEISKELFENPDKVYDVLGKSFEKAFYLIGQDNFYKFPSGKAVRIRHDQSGRTGKRYQTITVKERIGTDSLAHRKEVDLTCPPEENAIELFKMLGAEHHYSINKQYYVWKQPVMQFNIGVLIATYRVCDDKGENARYFLEVEVEKEGDFTFDQRMGALRIWGEVLEERLSLDKPVNVSLYELYAPKTQLQKLVAAVNEGAVKAEVARVWKEVEEELYSTERIAANEAEAVRLLLELQKNTVTISEDNFDGKPKC